MLHQQGPEAGSAHRLDAIEAHSATPTQLATDESKQPAPHPIEVNEPRDSSNTSSSDTRIQSNQRSDLRDATNSAEGHSVGVSLDPKHENFDFRKWLVDFRQRVNDSAGIKDKHTSVSFSELTVSGTAEGLQYQQTVTDLFLKPFRIGGAIVKKKTPRQILHNFNGLIRSGELLVVLGRPGSGCSTFLKTITGETYGLTVNDVSKISYDGIQQDQMVQEFKADLAYNQEIDKHFPHLTVGQTLEFAAATRTPAHPPEGMSRAEYSRYMAEVVMAVCGISHTYNTKVGNDFVRGVSGGERKRVSIAEMMLAGSSINAWDNSTRGLDSAAALKFVQSLRLAADLGDSAHAVAAYQASQAMYDAFDKAMVLYDGRQIYFGRASAAKDFFERQGWCCSPRQPTGDFLTAVTNPGERQARPGMEDKVPRTAVEFENYWRHSPEFKALKVEIAEYDAQRDLCSAQTLNQLRQAKEQSRARGVRARSAYMITVPMQVRLTTKRAYQRIWNDMAATIAAVVMNVILALLMGSMFYGSGDSTAGLRSKTGAAFIAILFNAMGALNEINTLYAQRPIVEKHKSYRLYRPATEAIASIVADIPIKFITAVAFNIVLYFLAGLRREASAFFLFFLIIFTTIFVMSALFRTLGAVTKTISQAMSLAGVTILALVIYTGFVIQVPVMHPWFSWIRWINPVFYAFEVLVANEFHGREIPCSAIVPSYTPRMGDSWICDTLGGIAGRNTLSGDDYILASFNYSYSRVWRNFGILLAFLVGFMTIFFVATELNSSTSNTAEVLVFKRGTKAPLLRGVNGDEEEKAGVDRDGHSPSKTGERGTPITALEPQREIFTWHNICYDIKIKDESRRLLDHVSGWVKPGTLTALMGVSGAGKTTLLDVLAQRTSIGIISGDMFVDGRPLNPSFRRKTGYVQQQDLHLETATVRESLRFSAALRQHARVPTAEKHAFVESVIEMLNMTDFANAVVGTPGNGLNTEQRKLLTIGIELAAKPKLLFFLDEPTSGLDSQSSWDIVAFLRRLADAGQAVLCTIHQPSAALFQEFDRLLFLAKGGKPVYFGDIGPNSSTMLDYFSSNGARACDSHENPAEYMIEVIGEPNKLDQDWPSVWQSSPERQAVEQQIDLIHAQQREHSAPEDEPDSDSEFAAPFRVQLYEVMKRIFQQYWRMPSYILAKWALGLASGLFIGFSFYQPSGASSMAAMFNVIYGVFMLTAMFQSLVQQIQPNFITQRDLYEVRERPASTYSWKVFLLSNITVELPYQVITGLLVFACMYYPIAGIQPSERQGLALLYLIQFFIYASTFAHMTIAAMPNAETAGAIITLMIMLCLLFCGVFQPPVAMPGFWVFMYRLSPFTYWIGGLVATQLHNRPVSCSGAETLSFDPPENQSCGSYLADFLANAPGQLQNPEDTSACRYCSVSVADQTLAGSEIFWDDRWRNFGIMWAHIIFNVVVAIGTYYMFRVEKGSRKEKPKS